MPGSAAGARSYRPEHEKRKKDRITFFQNVHQHSGLIEPPRTAHPTQQPRGSRSSFWHRAEERRCAAAGNKPESPSHVRARLSERSARRRHTAGRDRRSCPHTLRRNRRAPPDRPPRAAAALTEEPTGPGAAREPLPGRHLLGTIATRLPLADHRPCRKSLRRYRGNGRFRGGGLRNAAHGCPPRPPFTAPAQRRALGAVPAATQRPRSGASLNRCWPLSVMGHRSIAFLTHC